jgi:hypothetical protein
VIIDGAAVAQLRAARRMTLREVAARMRRQHVPGTDRADHTFVAIAERGLLIDVEPVLVIVLADALGSDLAEVTGRRHLTVARSGQ